MTDYAYDSSVKVMMKNSKLQLHSLFYQLMQKSRKNASQRNARIISRLHAKTLTAPKNGGAGSFRLSRAPIMSLPSRTMGMTLA
jgi:hypothetical protein